MVVSFGFLLWFRVLAVYPASDMASFGFLTPLRVLGLAMDFAGVAWALLRMDHPATVSGGVGVLLSLGAGFCWAGIAGLARSTAW